MKLQAYLEAHGISRRKFAKMLGVSQPAIVRYCLEDRIPNRETMLVIYRKTSGEVTPNDFYGVTE